MTFSILLFFAWSSLSLESYVLIKKKKSNQLITYNNLLWWRLHHNDDRFLHGWMPVKPIWLMHGVKMPCDFIMTRSFQSCFTLISRRAELSTRCTYVFSSNFVHKMCLLRASASMNDAVLYTLSTLNVDMLYFPSCLGPANLERRFRWSTNTARAQYPPLVTLATNVI